MAKSEEEAKVFRREVDCIDYFEQQRLHKPQTGRIHDSRMEGIRDNARKSNPRHNAMA